MEKQNINYFREPLQSPKGLKSRVALLLIQFLFPIGLSRMYMGCWLSGLIQLGFFILFLVMVLSANGLKNNNGDSIKAINVAAVLAAIFWGLWSLWDTIIIIICCLVGSDYAPVTFCRSRYLNNVWIPDGGRDKRVGFWFAILIIILEIAILVTTTSIQFKTASSDP